MRNDLIVAAISFAVGVAITWMSYVTVTLFDIKTDIAVTKVRVERLTKDMAQKEDK